MTAQDALRAVLRDVVGPALRRHGFKGSGSTWRRVNGSGDQAIVNVQSSAYSSADVVRCVVNLSVAPAAWLDWMVTAYGGSAERAPESWGLYRERLHPTGAAPGLDIWWEVPDVPDAASAAALDMVGQLERNGLPRLDELQVPGAMLEAARSQDRRVFSGGADGIMFQMAEAALTADGGPTPRFDEVLDALTSRAATQPPGQAAHLEAFVAWAHARAAAVAG